MTDSIQSLSTKPRKSTRGGVRPGAGRKSKAWHQANAGEETDADVARRARRAAADIRCLKRDELLGRLVDRAQVELTLTGIGAQVWANIERLPDRLAPQLAAAADEHAIYALLVEELRHAMTDLAAAIKAALPPLGDGNDSANVP